MNPRDIVFDVETKYSFDEVGGRSNFHKLGVSVVGVYIYGDDKYVAFEEHELPLFEKMLVSAGKIIGFNIHHFDLPVLQPYFSFKLKNLPTLDLMDGVEKSADFRISLNNLSETTLGAKKGGDGLQALKWYKEGKIEEIKKYCLKDVELTKDLYEFGKKNGHVLFYSRDASGRVAVPVNWNIDIKKEEDLNTNVQPSFF